MEYESDGDTNWNYRTQYSHRRIIKETEGLENKRTSIVEIGQNTKKSPGYLRRLAVAQTSVENYQIKLVGKTVEWVK